MYHTGSGGNRDIGINNFTEAFPYIDSSKKAILWTERDQNQQLNLHAVFKAEQNVISLSAQWWIIGGTSDHIDFKIWVPDDYKGKTAGFLGNYDSNHDNDFINRTGHLLLPQHQIEEATDIHMFTCELAKKCGLLKTVTC